MGSVVTLVLPKEREASQGKKNNSPRHCSAPLTEARIEKLAAPVGRPTYIYDETVPGLAVRVSPHAVRTYVFVKKIVGRTQRITLGRWPALRLSDARKAARRISGEIAAGIDPIAQRKAARQRATTCNDVWPSYLQHIKRKNRTWKRDEHRWLSHISPAIGRSPIGTVSVLDCQKIIDAEGKKHPVAANRLAALLGAFFAYAQKSEYVSRNPARGLSRYPETHRERFLSSGELQSFISACEASSQPWRDLFPLMLWTGARKGAVMAMRWADIDLVVGIWRIPALVAKNKKAAAVPLVPQALDILNGRVGLADKSPWVFPANSLSGHVEHAAKAWSSLIGRAGLADLRPHDLRRTIGSWLAASGANAFVIQKALTHQSQASAGAYAHLDVEAVRAALTAVTGAMQK